MDDTLTPRQIEVLQYASSGLLYKQIADAMKISPDTVRNHVHEIFVRMKVNNMTNAVAVALRQGWID